MADNTPAAPSPIKGKNRKLALLAAGGGVLFLVMRGHNANASGGVGDTGSADASQVTGQIVPVAAAGPGFGENTDVPTGGLQIGGDVNSPLYPSTVAGGSPAVVGSGNLTDPQGPVNVAGTGGVDTGTDTSTVGAPPSGHPGYKPPADPNYHPNAPHGNKYRWPDGTWHKTPYTPPKKAPPRRSAPRRPQQPRPQPRRPTYKPPRKPSRKPPPRRHR